MIVKGGLVARTDVAPISCLNRLQHLLLPTDEIDQDMVVVKGVSMLCVHRSGRVADQNRVGDKLLKARCRRQGSCERLRPGHGRSHIR